MENLEHEVYQIVENILQTFPQETPVSEVLRCIKHAHVLHIYLHGQTQKTN